MMKFKVDELNLSGCEWGPVVEFCDHSNERACGCCILQREIFWLAEQLLGFQEGCDAGFLPAFLCRATRNPALTVVGCTVAVKIRDNVYPKTGPEASERDLRYTSVVGDQPHTPAALPREREPAPIVQEVGRSGKTREISTPHRHSIHGLSNL